jgi:hypothetical protein
LARADGAGGHESGSAFSLRSVLGLPDSTEPFVDDRPKPCSMQEAQRALGRLVGAGFDAEIVEDDDNGTFGRM